MALSASPSPVDVKSYVDTATQEKAKDLRHINKKVSSCASISDYDVAREAFVSRDC